MSTSVKAVLFDVDGTLVDTNYLHTVAWWEAFAQAGHNIPMAPIHRAIGMGSDKLMSALLPPGRDTAADEDIETSHAALYSVYWSRLRPLPGAPELLQACHQHGLRVVLASSADPQELQILCSALGAEDVIHAATSAGDVEASKRAPIWSRWHCAAPAPSPLRPSSWATRCGMPAPASVRRSGASAC